MLALWGGQRFHRNAVMADVGFCVAFSFVVVGYGLGAEGDPLRRLIVASMGAIYSIRLAGHLFFNRVLGKPEDARYQTLRQQWGARAPFYIFLYFQGQAVAVAVFSLPLLVLMQNLNSRWSGWELMGFFIWVVALSGEAWADWQLERFRQNPRNRGKTCRIGLWRYSRHPNYFFEGLLWCAYVLMGIGVPYGWLTLIGPLLMILALLKITGIPFSESQALTNCGEDYRGYQQTTNAFIPWFPKDSHR